MHATFSNSTTSATVAARTTIHTATTATIRATAKTATAADGAKAFRVTHSATFSLFRRDGPEPSGHISCRGAAES